VRNWRRLNRNRRGETACCESAASQCVATGCESEGGAAGAAKCQEEGVADDGQVARTHTHTHTHLNKVRSRVQAEGGHAVGRVVGHLKNRRGQGRLMLGSGSGCNTAPAQLAGERSHVGIAVCTAQPPCLQRSVPFA
jgi:hypothetical protein